MATLFDKKERSPLSVIIYSVLWITFRALNSSEQIESIPSADILMRIIHIIVSIYILFKGTMLLKGTLVERQKRSVLEKIQIVFIALLMILLVFVIVNNIIYTSPLIRTTN